MCNSPPNSPPVCSKHKIPKIKSPGSSARWRCLECSKEYTKNKREDIRKEATELLGNKCNICLCSNTNVLQFKYIDGITPTSELRKFDRNKAKFLEEAQKKCYLICDRCNKEKNAENQPKSKNKTQENLKNKYHSNKQLLFEACGGECSACGYNKNINGITIYNPDDLEQNMMNGTVLYGNTESIIEKYQHCKVLCFNCIEHKSNTSEAKNHTLEDNSNTKVEWPIPKEILKKQVWVLPLSEIASLYSVSRQTVARLCDKYSIERPSEGYWNIKFKADNKVSDKKPIENNICSSYFCDIHSKEKEVYTTASGKKIYTCLSCEAERQSKNRKDNKKYAIDYLGGKCLHCGYKDCEEALEFHHIDPSTKKANITALLRNRKKLMEEVEKCILLCGNCHAEEEERLRVEKNIQPITLFPDKNGVFICKHHGESIKVKEYLDLSNVCSKCAHQHYLREKRYNKIFGVEYLGGKCVTCGYNDTISGLVFHHVDSGEKSHLLSGPKMYGLKEEIIKEAEKCVLLCHNCHATHHHKQPENFDDYEKYFNQAIKEDLINNPHKYTNKTLWESLKHQNQKEILEEIILIGEKEFRKKHNFKKHKFKALLKLWQLDSNSEFASDLVTSLDGSGISASKLKLLAENKGFEQTKIELNLSPNITIEMMKNFLTVFGVRLVSVTEGNLALSVDREERSPGFFWPPTKEELEKYVWEMSVVKLAEKYGVSGNAVNKWCKKYGVEKPSRGYWAKEYAEQGLHLPPKTVSQPPVSKSELEEKFLGEKMLIKDLAEVYGVGRKAMSRWLSFYGLK